MAILGFASNKHRPLQLGWGAARLATIAQGAWPQIVVARAITGAREVVPLVVMSTSVRYGRSTLRLPLTHCTRCPGLQLLSEVDWHDTLLRLMSRYESPSCG